MLDYYDPTDISSIQQRLSAALHRTIDINSTKLLMRHLSYVIEVSKNTNLTSITDIESGILLHIEDSMAALPEIESAIEGKLVDLGSGGGYPGIPLAIITGRNTTLIEATNKKALHLKTFVDEISSSDRIEVVAQRIENYSRSIKECFAVATARALSSLPALMELATPLLKIDGVLVAYKGNTTEIELQAARKAEETIGMELQDIRKLTLSDGKTHREIITYKKVRESSIQLPRKTGKAQNSPLRQKPNLFT